MRKTRIIPCLDVKDGRIDSMQAPIAIARTAGARAG